MNTKNKTLFVIIVLPVVLLFALALFNNVANASGDGGQSRIFLPVISKPIQGIYGTLTFNGSPAANVSVDLRHTSKLGNYVTTIDTVKTDANGRYNFPNAPSTSGEELIWPRWYNSDGDPAKLLIWTGSILMSYTNKSTVQVPAFDLAELQLISPADNATVSLPTVFHMQNNPHIADPHYVVEIFDFDPLGPYFTNAKPFSSQPGITITLSDLQPLGFLNNTPYAWDAVVITGDGDDRKGNYGISWASRTVQFSNLSAEIRPNTMREMPAKLKKLN